MKQKTVFVVSAIALLLAFAAGALFYAGQKEKAASQLAEANSAALIRPHSPVVGRADAPVVIVEFLDPACETCREFYPMVKQLMAANPEKISIVLRYAPFHPGSDKVVAMLDAAHRQGKFWAALETLLAYQSDWTQHHTANAEAAWRLLGGLGLNMEQMTADMNSPGTASVIAQDLADAKALNVTMTPEFFVNGKPLPSFGFEQLTELVGQELTATRAR